MYGYGGEIVDKYMSYKSSVNRNDFELLYGHVGFPIYSDFDPADSSFLTFLRDPVERVISHYYWVKNSGSHPDRNKPEIISSIDSYLTSGNKELDNGQIRMIIGDHDSAVGEIGKAEFKIALRTIEERYPVVGIMELFEQSLAVISKLHNLKIPPFKSKNVGSKLDDISETTYASIREINQWDYKLYEYCNERLRSTFEMDSLGLLEKVEGIYRRNIESLLKENRSLKEDLTSVCNSRTWKLATLLSGLIRKGMLTKLF